MVRKNVITVSGLRMTPLANSIRPKNSMAVSGSTMGVMKHLCTSLAMKAAGLTVATGFLTAILKAERLPRQLD